MNTRSNLYISHARKIQHALSITEIADFFKLNMSDFSGLEVPLRTGLKKCQIFPTVGTENGEIIALPKSPSFRISYAIAYDLSSYMSEMSRWNYSPRGSPGNYSIENENGRSSVGLRIVDNVAKMLATKNGLEKIGLKHIRNYVEMLRNLRE